MTTVTQGCYSIITPSLRAVTAVCSNLVPFLSVCASMLSLRVLFSPSIQGHPAWEAAGLGDACSEGGGHQSHVQSLTSLTLPPIPALQPPSAPPSAGGHPAQLPRREAAGSLWQGPSPARSPCGHPAGAAPGEQAWQSPGCRLSPPPQSPRRAASPQSCPLPVRLPAPWGTRGPHSLGWKQGFELERVCLSALVVLGGQEGVGRRGRHQGGHSLKGHRPPSQGSRIPV